MGEQADLSLAPTVIDQFRGEYAFLSNFHREAGFCVENKFQASKTLDPDVRRRFDLIKPGQAKRLGQTVELRPDWDAVRAPTMRMWVHHKFERYPRLRALLLDTGEAQLIEGNYWHDNVWGDCRFSRAWWAGTNLAASRGESLPEPEPCPHCADKKGLNILGQMLMAERGEFAMAEERQQSLRRMTRLTAEAGDYSLDRQAALNELTALREELGEY